MLYIFSVKTNEILLTKLFDTGLFVYRLNNLYSNRFVYTGIMQVEV